MLHRYHNIEYVLQLDISTGVSLIAKAMEEKREARIFQQWTAQLPVMAFSGEIISFADYKAHVTGANIDRRPASVIDKELDEVERIIKEGGGT